MSDVINLTYWIIESDERRLFWQAAYNRFTNANWLRIFTPPCRWVDKKVITLKTAKNDGLVSNQTSIVGFQVTH